jgi:AraC-like DNA-binding protein
MPRDATRTGSAPAAPASFEAHQREILRICFEDLLYVLRTQGRPELSVRALAAARLQRADLREPSSRLTFHSLYAALDWLYHDAGLPLIGMHLGLRRRFSDYGAFGDALQATEHYARLLGLAARYFSSAWGDAALEVRITDRRIVCRYHLHPGIKADPVPLLQSMTAASVAFVRQILPDQDVTACEVRYRFPAPPHARDIEQLLGCTVRFNQRHTELHQPGAWQDRAVDLGTVRTPSAHAQAQHLWRNAGGETGWGGRVQQHLLRADGGFANESDVAEQLGLTPRTLRRRLTAEGQSFRQLLLAARLDLARRQLETRGVTVAEVAERLGYAQPASFYRAYKAHFGRPPRAGGKDPGEP